MTLKSFFSPLRLPFTVPTFGLGTVGIILIKSVVRLVVLYLVGPIWYFISRGRIGLALALFFVGILFNTFGKLALGERVLTYLCLVGELIQVGVSLYAHRVRVGRPSPIEYVEEIEVVDQHGNFIRRMEKLIQPDDL